MLKAILRWVLLLATLLVVGPLLAHAARTLRDVDGGNAFTLLVGESPLRGVLLGAGACAAALVLGLIGSRFFALNAGYAMAGLVLGWASWELGDVEDIIRRARDGSDMTRLALEGGVLTGIAAVIAAVLSRVAAKHRPTPDGVKNPVGGLRAALFHADSHANNATAALAALAGAAGCAAAVWIVCVTPLKGQALFATFMGGIAAGAAANAAAGAKAHVQPAVGILGMLIVAVAGPIVARLIHGPEIVEAVFANRLFPPARPLSLDWASGALLGVPIGMSWTGAVLDVRAVETS